MRVVVKPDADCASNWAADFIANFVRHSPDCVLGLATGTSPLGIYRELVRRHREEGLSFRQVTTFNLDEYIGLAANDSQSYRYFMNKNLFEGIGIPIEQTHVPDGRALDFENYCRAYEQRISDSGGIDLQLLGIGTDGHIAFNEPGSSLGSRTRVKTLAQETVRDNARFFEDENDVPRMAITMGVGTILEARRCLLLALGEKKAEAVRDAIEGPITAQVTASALQLHRDVVVVLDEPAASKLERLEYYNEVERAQEWMESGGPAKEKG